jgi:hypothetical protein
MDGEQQAHKRGSRMKTWLISYFLLASILLVCPRVSAHHGNAAYSDKPVEFKNATVTKWLWSNPHCIVEFDVKDQNGKVVSWTAETGSPEALRLLGWTKNSLKPGDVITIDLHAAKTGAPAGRFSKIVLADGTVLGDSQGSGVGTANSGGYGRGSGGDASTDSK